MFHYIFSNWGRWEGPDNDKYAAQKYENGLNCWNGPNRSVKVGLFRRQDFCLCENKGADQLCSNCTADQHLCFRYR